MLNCLLLKNFLYKQNELIESDDHDKILNICKEIHYLFYFLDYFTHHTFTSPKAASGTSALTFSSASDRMGLGSPIQLCELAGEDHFAALSSQC